MKNPKTEVGKKVLKVENVTMAGETQRD